MRGLLTLGFRCCLVRWEVVPDRLDQQPEPHWNAEQMWLNTWPGSWRALLPLTITGDKSTDTGRAGRPDPAWQLILLCTQCGPAPWFPLHCHMQALHRHPSSLSPQSQGLAVCHIYWFHSKSNLHGSLSVVLRESRPIPLSGAGGWLLRTAGHHWVSDGNQCNLKQPCGQYRGQPGCS